MSTHLQPCPYCGADLTPYRYAGAIIVAQVGWRCDACHEFLLGSTWVRGTVDALVDVLRPVER